MSVLHINNFKGDAFAGFAGGKQFGKKTALIYSTN